MQSPVDARDDTRPDPNPEHDAVSPDEPQTPMWLPLLGAALLLMVIIVFVATRPAGKTRAELTKEAAGTASAEPSASAGASASAKLLAHPPPNLHLAPSPPAPR